MKRKNTGMKGAGVLLAISATGVAALAWYVIQTPGARDIRTTFEQPNQSAVVPSVDRQSRPEPQVSAVLPTIRLPKAVGDLIVLGDELPVPSGEEPMRFLVNQVLTASSAGGRALLVDVRDGIAVISFDDAAAQSVGSAQEGKFLDLLQTGFSQFSSVKSIKLENRGNALSSGHFDLSEPLEVMPPDQAAAAGKDAAKSSQSAAKQDELGAQPSQESGPDPASTPGEP